MARIFTPIYCAIWRDPDFCALPSDAQRTYFMLVSQDDITACGTLPLRLRRWSKTLPESDRHTLELGLKELAENGFILIDDDTEELLCRTFAKWDGGYKHSQRLRGVIASAEAIQSLGLRTAVALELRKLGVETAIPIPPSSHDRATPVPPATDDRATDVPPQSDSDATTVLPSSQRFLVKLAGTEPGTVNLENGTYKGEREPAAENGQNDPLPEFCPEHQPNGTDEPCGPCAGLRKRREARDRAELTERLNASIAAAEARRACTRCDEDGWILDPDTEIPVARCSHQPLEATSR